MTTHETLMSIWEKIAFYDTIILHRHVMPDYDALGSAFGLREIIKDRWQHKAVYVMGKDAEKFDLVPAHDTVSDAVWQGALAIVLDCGIAERVDDSRFQNAEFIIKIDHHRIFDSDFGDISWVDTSMPATAEMIVHLYQAGQGSYDLKLSKEACSYLYYGMMTDTGCFRHLEAEQAPRFMAAAKLLAETGGLSPREVMTHISAVDEAVLRYTGHIKTAFNRPVSQLAYMKIDTNLLKQFGISWREARGHCNSMMGIKGVEVWALFVEAAEEGRIYCEFRSIKNAVNEFAFRYGGGGHYFASGCHVANWQKIDELIEELKVFAAE